MLKKVKSAQKSACPNLSVCRVFPPTKKHDRSADRQMTDLIFRDTVICAPLRIIYTFLSRRFDVYIAQIFKTTKNFTAKDLVVYVRVPVFILFLIFL